MWEAFHRKPFRRKDPRNRTITSTGGFRVTVKWVPGHQGVYGNGLSRPGVASSEAKHEQHYDYEEALQLAEKELREALWILIPEEEDPVPFWLHPEGGRSTPEDMDRRRCLLIQTSTHKEETRGGSLHSMSPQGLETPTANLRYLLWECLVLQEHRDAA